MKSSLATIIDANDCCLLFDLLAHLAAGSHDVSQWIDGSFVCPRCGFRTAAGAGAGAGAAADACHRHANDLYQTCTSATPPTPTTSLLLSISESIERQQRRLLHPEHGADTQRKADMQQQLAAHQDELGLHRDQLALHHKHQLAQWNAIEHVFAQLQAVAAGTEAALSTTTQRIEYVVHVVEGQLEQYLLALNSLREEVDSVAVSLKRAGQTDSSGGPGAHLYESIQEKLDQQLREIATLRQQVCSVVSTVANSQNTALQASTPPKQTSDKTPVLGLVTFGEDALQDKLYKRIARLPAQVAELRRCVPQTLKDAEGRINRRMDNLASRLDGAERRLEGSERRHERFEAGLKATQDRVVETQGRLDGIEGRVKETETRLAAAVADRKFSPSTFLPAVDLAVELRKFLDCLQVRRRHVSPCALVDMGFPLSLVSGASDITAKLARDATRRPPRANNKAQDTRTRERLVSGAIARLQIRRQEPGRQVAEHALEEYTQRAHALSASAVDTAYLILALGRWARHVCANQPLRFPIEEDGGWIKDWLLIVIDCEEGKVEQYM